MQILIQITSKYLCDLSRNKIPSSKMFMLLVVFLANLHHQIFNQLGRGKNVITPIYSKKTIVNHNHLSTVSKQPLKPPILLKPLNRANLFDHWKTMVCECSWPIVSGLYHRCE